jgi:hypothetical protein
MTLSKLLATGAVLVASVGVSTSAQGTAPDDSAPAEPVITDDAVQPGEVVHSWALAPAGEADGATRSSFSYTAAPGTVIEDALTVFNFGNEALPFRIYATDAFNNDDGDFSLLAGEEVPIGIGTWVDIELETLVVNPGRQVTIPFTITVPEGAASGDHAGALLASSPTLSLGEENEVVTLDRRAGSRLFVRVTGEIRPELSIEQLSSEYRQQVNPLSGTSNVTYRVENRGNVRLSGRTAVEIDGPFGLGGASTSPAAFDELLPGEGFDVTAEIGGVEALVLLDTTVTVDGITQGDGEELPPVVRSTSAFAPPITLLLLLLALLFGLIAARAIRRHRNPRVQVIAPGDERELQTTP